MLGAGAYALVNNIEAPRAARMHQTLPYTGTCGTPGLYPSIPLNPINSSTLAVGALIGGGGVMKNERYKGVTKVRTWITAAFSSAEPHVNFEMNITSYLRLASWRLVPVL